MPVRTCLVLLSISLPWGCSETPAIPDAAPRPNIVLIMADDMGYSDLGSYGGEIDTPHLDRLASNGVRFTQFYNASRCCPTRASLLTGLYAHQAGVGRMTFDQELPGYRGTLARHAITAAEALQAAGYHTAMVGKWHLSPTNDSPDNALWVSGLKDLGEFSDPATYPANRGFDEHWGTIWGVVNFFDPFSLVHNTTPVENLPDDFYYTDALNDRAADYIDQYSRDEKPFFLGNSGFVVGGWRSAQAGMRQFRDERSRAVSAHPRNRGSLAGGLGGLKAGGRRSPRPSGAP